MRNDSFLVKRFELWVKDFLKIHETWKVEQFAFLSFDLFEDWAKSKMQATVQNL